MENFESKLKMSDVFDFENCWGYDGLEMAQALADGFIKGAKEIDCTHFEMRVKFVYDDPDYVSYDVDNFVNEFSNLPNIDEVDDILLFASK